MTTPDPRSTQRPVDERATTPGAETAVAAKGADESLAEPRGRTAGPTRASMVSALRGAGRRDRGEPSVVAEESRATPAARPWSGHDSLAAGAIVLAPAAVAVMGAFGAPLWLIGLTASALILAVVVMLWGALSPRSADDLPSPARAGRSAGARPDQLRSIDDQDRGGVVELPRSGPRLEFGLPLQRVEERLGRSG